MKTIFVTGNDTGVGKTWVVGTLVKYLVGLGKRVQVVKPIETGVVVDKDGDAYVSTQGVDNGFVERHTLYSFEQPLAPTSAAEYEGVRLKLGDIVEKIEALPESDFRIVEGAGGIAVPLDHDGLDGLDLVKGLGVNYTVLVVENRLGAINQARLLSAYVGGIKNEVGFWLNECRGQEASVLESNRKHIESLSIPIWMEQGVSEGVVKRLDFIN